MDEGIKAIDLIKNSRKSMKTPGKPSDLLHYSNSGRIARPLSSSQNPEVRGSRQRKKIKKTDLKLSFEQIKKKIYDLLIGIDLGSKRYHHLIDNWNYERKLWAKIYKIIRLFQVAISILNVLGDDSTSFGSIGGLLVKVLRLYEELIRQIFEQYLDEIPERPFMLSSIINHLQAMLNVFQGCRGALPELWVSIKKISKLTYFFSSDQKMKHDHHNLPLQTSYCKLYLFLVLF